MLGVLDPAGTQLAALRLGLLWFSDNQAGTLVRIARGRAACSGAPLSGRA
jgi:hypothetical protein